MYSAVDPTLERRPRALVLDGDAAALEGLRRSLEDLRFEVLSARDGASGLELLLDQLLDLDVLVVDVHLPERDARSLAALIRRAGGEHDLAIVVVARGATAELRAELLALGVDAVVDRSGGPRVVAATALDAVAARAPAPGAAPPRSSPPAEPSGAWTTSFSRWAPALT